MKKINCCLWLVCVLVANTGQAQHLKMDSLLELSRTAPDDTNKITLYFKAGAAVLYQDPVMAMAQFNKGLALARRLRHNAGIERCFTSLSLALSLNGNYDSSLVMNDSGLLYARKVGNPSRLAVVYLNRADLYRNLQDLAAALKNCDSALKYTEQAPNNKNGLGRIYSVMGDIALEQQAYARAIEYLDRSTPYFLETRNMQMVGMNIYGKGEVYLFMKEFNKAIPFFNRAIAIADSVQDIPCLTSAYACLAQIYIEQKNYTAGEKMATKALKYTLQTGNRTQEGTIYDLFAHLYVERGDYAKGVDMELRAYQIIKEEKDLVREYATATYLAEAYEKAGNSADAYKYSKISAELNDSLARKKFNDETARLMTTFDVSLKDKEIKLLNKEKELKQQQLNEQQYLLIGSLVVVALALVGIGLLVSRYRLRQRMKELELRNRIAADLHDEVGSSLSSIHMLSQVAAQQPVFDSSHSDILNRVSTNARETMDKMGDIVWMIKPGESEGVSVAQRMERYLYEMCSSQNIGFSTEGEDVLQHVKLSMQQRKNFYLIFKEAVNNAVKYSGTEKIDVQITLQGRQLTMRIQDYGKGFVMNENGNGNSYLGGGNGLQNMKNRAKELGGDLQLESALGKGTVILLKFTV